MGWRLVDLPGLGPRMRDKLVERFGSEPKALEVLLEGDVSSLLAVMSERQALSLAKGASGMRYGVKALDFLGTEEAERIYRALLELISSHAHTEYARLKIRTLFPSPSMELIHHNRALSQRAMDAKKKLDGSEVGELLRKVKPLRDKPSDRVRDRAVAVSSLQSFQALKARGLDRLIDIHFIESSGELRDIASGYSHVSQVGGPLSGDVESAESMDEWYLVPEAVLAFYKNNLEVIHAAVKAAVLIQGAGLMEVPGLDKIASLIDSLEKEEDPEVQRLSQILKKFNGSVEEASKWANTELKRRIEACSVTLGGMDLLQAMAKGDGIRELFMIQMRGTFHEVLKEAKTKAGYGLDLKGSERASLEDLFSLEVCYPLELNREAQRRFEQDLRSRLESRSLRQRRLLAKALAEMRPAFDLLVRQVMEFDFLYSLGDFAVFRHLRVPELMEVPCIGFQDGRNLFLKDPEPVSYSLGQTGMVEDEERVAIMSGVNSGGKTSLLDLVAQTVILAHMGMPVPAEHCRLGIFEEIYYFSKARGTLNAGAFETAMRQFSVVENPRRKLVLADELEAITEPGASAKIVACMLDELNDRGSAAVFVSHLAEEVRRFAKTSIRVDGIEAEGLDEDNNLVLRRSPRYNYLAKSTPELILDRLVKTTRGDERDFYARLLRRFQ